MKLKMTRQGRTQSENHYEEVLDEVSCYIEKTLQLLWLIYKTGIFEQSNEINSLQFRVKNQSKDHYRLTLVKLRYRLKVCTFLTLQLVPELALVEKIQSMHEH